ncbi:MAG TPA: MBL fold metallo-hydrolase, partial [Rectinemataceae bacterium]|nr:MBL fold metallo-hydrolase [Rectinemataceae bacterium]
MRVHFLGTGTSFGVPVIGCSCGTCRSRDPRDARYRSSALVTGAGAAVLIDAGPEFRLQARRAGLGLRPGIERLDALLLTHAHADHVAGLDDVRPLTSERVLPVYGNTAAIAETRDRFDYVFRETQIGGGKPRIELREAPELPFQVGGLGIRAIPLLHGALGILGWRFGRFAYITDCSSIPEPSLGLLEGVEVLAINGLRWRPHATHFTVDQGI